jgi:hypothetical protein
VAKVNKYSIIMKFRISKVLSISSFFIGIAFLFTGCPHPTNCTGEIKCVDLATGNAVAGATVKIFVTPPAGFYPCDGGQVSEKILTADGSGIARFCLALPATPSVLVTAGSQTGSGVIATEVGQTVSVTIKLK